MRIGSDGSISSASTYTLGRGRPFPYHLLRKTPVEYVNEVPRDVNGSHVYKIPATRSTYLDAIEDDRWFQLHTSMRRGLQGVRKIGECAGNFVCSNADCAFSKMSLACENTSNFRRWLHGLKKCASCGSIAKRCHCGALKLVELDETACIVTVKYVGQHYCQPTKNNRRRRINSIKAILTEDKHHHYMKPKELAISEVTSCITPGQMDEAMKVAEMFADMDAVHTAQREVLMDHHSEKDSNSVDALLRMKKTTDAYDTFFLYEISSAAFSTQQRQDYVFKTSHECCEVAIEADIDGPANPLQEENIYVDGKHGRVERFISLAMWIRHQALNKLIRLCSMEVRSESTENLVKFHELFSQACAEVKGVSGYKINPRAFMCDASGAMQRAVEEF